jgi:hypothetical protein
MARWLPADEWPRLTGTEMETIWPHLPAGAQVWVVEHGDKIVACGSVFDLRHHEGLWVDPGVRHSREVWRLAAEKLTAVMPFVTPAVTPAVARFIEHCGGEPLPMAQWYRVAATTIPDDVKDATLLTEGG